MGYVTTAVAIKLVAVLLTAALGYGAGRFRLLTHGASDSDAARVLSNAALYVFVPRCWSPCWPSNISPPAGKPTPQGARLALILVVSMTSSPPSYRPTEWPIALEDERRQRAAARGQPATGDR